MKMPGKSIHPNELLDLMGGTPTDNNEGPAAENYWESMLSGWQLRDIFRYQELLDYCCRYSPIFSPLSVTVLWQRNFLRTFVTDPIKQHVQLIVRLRQEPDIFRDKDSDIYKNYAYLLQHLCERVITDDSFDRDKAQQLATTSQGKEILTFFVNEFSKLEKTQTSRGLTRLRAMRELLACLLVVITETPLKDVTLPFMRKSSDGSDMMTLDAYLGENRRRFENLYRAEAFDPKHYAERETRGKLGCSSYEIVNDSCLHSVTLRHYPLPAGVKPLDHTLYLSTPLINKPELFDLAEGKSVIEGLLREGYRVYMVDYGQPAQEDGQLGLDFYVKTVHDHCLDLITRLHPGDPVSAVGYCMGGALILPYLARRAEERLRDGLAMDVQKVCLMAAPVKFDDGASGQGAMRTYIRKNYNPYIMEQLFSAVNIPPQVIDQGINEIQPGVQYSVLMGFYERACQADTMKDAAPFLFWLTHGTRFPARTHYEWLSKFFLGNELMKGTFCLPSRYPDLDGKPVNMNALKETGVSLFDYRGTRDPIAPPGSCVASENWGQTGIAMEKDIGHIFVVSKKLLAEFLYWVNDFLRRS
jgi:poly(3-hydroxyalkanoate) synthetase